MLTGRYPRDFSQFKGNSSECWKFVLETPTIPIRQYNVEIPNNLASVIDLALTDRSNLHFKAVDEFRQAINQTYL